MTDEKYKGPHLRDGSEWIDHEDLIVGDEKGLKSLIKACETALKDGEYLGSDLGEWVGVRKMDSKWFKDSQDTPQTKFQNAVLAVVLVALVVLIVVGMITTIRWLV